MKKISLITMSLLISTSAMAQQGGNKATNILQNIAAPTLSAPSNNTPPSPTEIGQEGFALDPNFNLRSVQEIWNDPEVHSQTIKRYPYDPATTYPLQLRQNMSSLIVLPESEIIDIVSLSDTLLFNYVYLGAQGGKKNMLSVSGSAPGTDTNLQIITKSGRVYSLYLRNDPVNSKNVPTLTAYITDPTTNGFQQFKPLELPELTEEQKKGNPSKPSSSELSSIEFQNKLALKEAKLDYLDSLPITGNVNLEYKITGNLDIAPKAVFDDGDFVYLDFSDTVKFGELPVVHRVVNGIDERVNTQWDSAKQWFVIKTLSREGFTLRSGDKVVCIKPA